MSAAVAILFGCQRKSASSSAEEAKEAQYVAEAYTVDSLLTYAEAFVGDTLVVRGFVRHTCKHSGRRCFVSGEDRKTKMRIEAGGQIGGFNKELIGSEIAVRGVVRENRTTRDELLKAEAEVQAMQATASSEAQGEQCESTVMDISAKKAFMDLNHRDYYAEYYIDGVDYEVLD